MFPLTFYLCDLFKDAINTEEILTLDNQTLADMTDNNYCDVGI